MTESPYERGKTLAKEGHFEEALPLFEEATRRRGESPEVWLALAACYFRVERHDDYREAIRKALALDPDHAPTKRFLRQLTGTDVIPAADTGRPKIVVEEETVPFAQMRGEGEKAPGGGFGCLGTALLGAILVVLGYSIR